jgi:hypothetical protein
VKAFASICAIIFLAVAAFFAAIDFVVPERVQDREAVLVKDQVAQTLSPLFWYDEDISLQNIGGISWDLVCLGTYEAKGIDVASAHWIAAQALKKEDRLISSYKVADEYYTELKGSRYGLVFISHASWLVVGTVFEAEVDLRSPPSCVPAQDAILKYKANCCAEADKSKQTRIFALEKIGSTAKEGE